MLGKKSTDYETITPAAGSGDPRGISVVSKEMRIVGDCETDGPLRIEGKITGDVRAKALELAQSGSVSGDLAMLGDGKGDDVFIIDGRVDGTVRARLVEVRKSGVVLGGVVADQATIHGRVKGGIVARVRLGLEDTAVVEGDVRARRLSLKEGGQVNGTILMGERAEIDGSAKPAAAEAPSEDAGEEQELASAGAASGTPKARGAKE